jgi:hypothetical protein
MLTREQVYTMLMMRNREGNLFSTLPPERLNDILNFADDEDPNSDIAIALKHVAEGKKENVTALIAMLEENPRLVLQAGNVMLPGGSEAVRTTLLECAIFAGDPTLAELILPYFSKVNADKEKEKQLARCRPHIEALKRQVELKQPAYDLKTLFDKIKSSSPAEIAAALDINSPTTDRTLNTPLRAEFAKFRKAVRPPKKIPVGMHYKHYTTLMQAFDLLYSEWKNLSNNDTEYDKCRLVARQIIGYLQKSLPSIDRFAFARAFQDEERTLQFIYDLHNSYPPQANDDAALSDLGFDRMIFGRGVGCVIVCLADDAAARRDWLALETSCRAKTSNLQNLYSHAREFKRRRV